jgi:hypothetical protein
MSRSALPDESTVSSICLVPCVLWFRAFFGRSARRESALQPEHRVLQAKEEVLTFKGGSLLLQSGGTALTLPSELVQTGLDLGQSGVDPSPGGLGSNPQGFGLLSISLHSLVYVRHLVQQLHEFRPKLRCRARRRLGWSRFVHHDHLRTPLYRERLPARSQPELRHQSVRPVVARRTHSGQAGALPTSTSHGPGPTIQSGCGRGIRVRSGRGRAEEQCLDG